jgi:hypothetical protein
MKTWIVVALFVLLGAGIVLAAAQPQNIGYVQTDNPMQLYSRTKAQLALLTPDAVGQVVYCNDCSQIPVCISSAATRGSWASVAVSTQATAGLGLCQ